MLSWTCPHCGAEMYSSWDRRDEEIVICLACEGTFVNTYYVIGKKEGEGSQKQCAIQKCAKPAAHKTPDGHTVCAECWGWLMEDARKGGQPK